MKLANCHMDKQHVARGLCRSCYDRERNLDPVLRKRASILAARAERRRMLNEEYAKNKRDRRRVYDLARRADPEYLKRQAIYRKTRRADPQYVEHVNSLARARYAKNPELRKRNNERDLKRRQDPLYKARKNAADRERQRRNRELKKGWRMT